MKTLFDTTINIIPATLHVCVGMDSNEILDWAKKNKDTRLAGVFSDKNTIKYFNDGIDGSNGFFMTLTHPKKGKVFILWLKEFGREFCYTDILIHEVIHFKQMIFDLCRIENEREFEAYFVESITRGIRSKLLQQKKNS